MALPSLIKAEVKLTTGMQVTISARELEALEVEDRYGAGILAALFVGGRREADGRWVIVDAAEWRNRKGDSISAARPVLVSHARTQPHLDELRRHVDETWPAFLEGWMEVAARGHEALIAELERAHREGTLSARLPKHVVLDVDHRETIRKLVEQNGESDAGRLVQDLLAYLIALAGYGAVTNNPVGVPDFVLEGRPDAAENVSLRLTEDEAARLLELCERAVETELAERIRNAMRRGSAAKST